MEDLFESASTRDYMKELIYKYFDERGAEAELISSLIAPDHIEVDFQAMPSVEPAKFINNFKSVSARKFLGHFPELRQKVKGLWNNAYFLATREQYVSEHLRKFKEQQMGSRAVKRWISATDPPLDGNLDDTEPLSGPDPEEE